MKKLTFILLSIFIIFISCNSDDVNTNEVSIVGSWKVYERGFYENNSYTWTNIQGNCLNVEFRSDNTFTGYDFFDYPSCEQFNIYIGNWIKTGNTLNLIVQNSQNGTQYDIDLDVEILSISSNTMDLKFAIPIQATNGGDIIFIHKYSRL